MRLRNILLISFGWAAVFLATSAASGQSTRLPTDIPAWIQLDLHAAEAALLADAADGRLDDHELLAAALAVDGICDPILQDRYRQQFAGWIAELRATLPSQSSAITRSEAIFNFLQRRVLRGSYRESCSSLTELFEHGRYNCVSATIIFCCLAEQLQINMQAAESPGHVIARLTDAGKQLDIETTCRDWSQGTKPADTKGRDTFRGLSSLGLLSLIYFNHGVDAVQSGDFDAAVVENIKALRLDPASQTARSNLLAALNNGALSASDKGRHDAALERLRFARSIAPEFEQAATNLPIIRRRRILEFCDRNEFLPALALIREGRGENPHDRDLQAFEVAVSNRQGLRLLEADRIEEAVNWYREALQRHPQDRLLATNFRVAAMRWAEEAFRRHDYAEAISRTEYAGRPGELDPARLDNLRFGYQRWVGRLRAAGRDAEALRVARQAADDPFLAWPAEANAQGTSGEPSDLTQGRG